MDDKVVTETGVDFLCRLLPRNTHTLGRFGEVSSGDFIVLSTDCVDRKSAILTELLSIIILPEQHCGLQQMALYLDLDYRFNMLKLLSAMEAMLKSQQAMTDDLCDKITSKAPSNMLLVRCSTEAEVLATINSIKETVLKHKLSFILCDNESIYHNSKMATFLYRSLYKLTTTCKVTVIFAYYTLPDFRDSLPKLPDSINWRVETVFEANGFSVTVNHQASNMDILHYFGLETLLRLLTKLRDYVSKIMKQSVKSSHHRESDSSSSDRKRRITMPRLPVIPASMSETSVPVCKVGRSTSRQTLSEELRCHSSSSHMGREEFRMKSIGDGVRKSLHECMAIISEKGDPEGATIMCKVQCHLDDIWQYNGYHPHPVRRQPPHTAQNCVNQSMRDLTRNQLTCIESLHSGTFSKIFTAYSEEQYKYVVIKLLNKGDHHCKRVLRSYKVCPELCGNQNEGQLLTEIRHENIVKLLSCFETSSDKRALVLEFCENGRLSSLLNKLGAMSEPLACKYFKQMMAAVAHVHQSGYALRNICLKHFLLTSGNQIKLIDMGSAADVKAKSSETTGIHGQIREKSLNSSNAKAQSHTTDDLRADLRSLGFKPQKMQCGFQAPEMLTRPSHDPAIADIWSLGACLYTMVTAINTTLAHTLASSYKTAFRYPESSAITLSVPLCELLAGMLEYLPSHRFSLNRVTFCEWMSNSCDGTVVMGGVHLVSQRRKLKLSQEDIRIRKFMEV